MHYLQAEALVRLSPDTSPGTPGSLEVIDPAVVGIREDGTIGFVGPTLPDERMDADDDVTDLGSVALVAGQVNAHSHAFQRAIRGRTEYLPADRQNDDFWSWREAMYGAALSFDADQLEAIARQAFAEMLRAGYTTVGEFHYLHHRRDGTAYRAPNELAIRMIRAARDVGLRICLLRSAYHRGGFDTPATDRQRRFIEPDVDTYLDRLDQLQSDAIVADDDAVQVGVAPHSIRACPASWLRRLAEAARRRQYPLHIHVSEQTAELEQSRAEYESTPIEALHELGVLGPQTTLVHATHATEHELNLIADTNSSVCACPSTERNLGDGWLPASELIARDVPVSLGSDSQADIDPWGEMRLVEYHERLRRRARNVLATERLQQHNISSGTCSTAAMLWPMGANHGADALGMPPGRLVEDAPADLVGIDLSHRTLHGATINTLADHIALSMPTDAVRDVWVDGNRVLEQGALPDAERYREEFERAARAMD
jgi:formimidoylglutamate deiminase